MIDYAKYLELELIAGCDEVGRGPLVGDVVAAAVILDPNKPIAGLADSKKISEKKREQLFPLICEQAVCYAVGRASPEEIDQLNILQASMLAMQRAILGLKIHPVQVLVDGNRCPEVPFPCLAIVKGDDKVAAISAASIIAKVIRDKEMHQLHQLHPNYGFDRHKGYPTKDHLMALQSFGIIAEHRKSFKPVQRILNTLG